MPWLHRQLSGPVHLQKLVYEMRCFILCLLLFLGWAQSGGFLPLSSWLGQASSPSGPSADLSSAMPTFHPFELHLLGESSAHGYSWALIRSGRAGPWAMFSQKSIHDCLPRNQHVVKVSKYFDGNWTTHGSGLSLALYYEVPYI